MPDRLRASVVCVHKSCVLLNHFQDPRNKALFWAPPGGGVEEGEEPYETAEREALEETGYAVRLHREHTCVAVYDFHWNGLIYHCTTHFFLASLLYPSEAPQIVDDESFILGCEWVPIPELPTRMQTHPEILHSVQSLVS